MANKFPLQAGDRTPDFSGRDTSTAADRRSQEIADIHKFEGGNPAPSRTEPVGPLWKTGQVAPNGFLTAPFTPIHTEGDTSGEGTKCYEIDIYSYGDSIDPTAPTRSRTVDNYTLDSDFDGHLN